jgi:pyruvate kinase
VLANLDAVIAALAPHADERAPYPSARAFYRGQRLLERNSTELFGRSRLRRAIMVTLGTEAQDADYVRNLARHGMDVARINGAHDAPDVWARLVANVRRAGQTERRDLRILFDLAGPSCRTGEVAPAGRGRLKSGDRLILVRDLASDLPHFPHQVCCTLPEVLDKLAPGHAIWLDDGKLQGTVEERSREGVVVRVVRTGPKGVKLKPEKGLVFPDTELGLAPLMLADLAALDFAMPEMQEELLWLCEAAHVPVVWATEVLENLRKKGIFVRGEMTDAAMSGRAECVMLNKGPYLGQSIDVLQGLLMRMSEHQNKKTPRLRALHAWEREPGEAE